MKKTISAYCFAMLASVMCAQVNAADAPEFATEIRHAGSSSSLITQPTEHGKMATYFVNLQDGDAVKSPFRVIFGVIGLGVAPAGYAKENTGHHHLLIDTDIPSNLNVPLPTSDKIVHFGRGETETEVTLPPGKHTLQLLFANDKDIPLFKTKAGTETSVYSKKITITVERIVK